MKKIILFFGMCIILLSSFISADTLNVSKDTQTAQADGNTNYGSGANAGFRSKSGGNELRAYFGFDKTGITSVDSAVIYFYDYVHYNTPAGVSIEHQIINNTFGEATLTWNNQGTELSGTWSHIIESKALNTYTVGSWVAINITDEFNNAEDEFTLRMKPNPPDFDGNNNMIFFATKENTSGINRAYINYTLGITPTFSTILSYPSNTATYYGDYNGSVLISLANVNGTATCNINDSRWSFLSNDNSTYIFINNTQIADSNISLYVNCTDTFGGNSSETFWFYLDTIVDVFFYDEDTLNLINQTINFDLITEVASQNYTTTQNLTINSLDPGNYEISYTSDGYVTRQNYINVVEGQKHVLNLYLINSSIGTQIITDLYDEYGNKLNNFYIDTYRRINGVYYHVERSKSNSDGQTDFYAVQNTPMYYWIIKDTDELIYKITSESEIYGSTLEFNIFLGQPIDHIFSKLNDYSYSLTFNNNTNVWTYIFNDVSGTSSYNKLAIYKLLDGSLVSETGTTQTTGTLTINLSSLYENGTTYIAKVTANASPEFSIESQSYTYPKNEIEIGEIGLFMTAFIVILVAFIGFWNPAVMFILEALAFILTSMFGLHHLSYTSVTIISVVCIIFAYIVSDRT